MASINATVEIDRSGRLVVPKKVRDALCLVPGTKLSLRQEGLGIVLEPEHTGHGLYRKDGILVYDSGRPVPPEAVNWIDEDREERIASLG